MANTAIVRQCLLVPKAAVMMPRSFSLESGMKSAGCGGPNGMRFLPGQALVLLG